MERIQQYLSSDNSSTEDKPCTRRRKRSLNATGGITLLQSPDEIDKSNHVFKRNKPHVQGNWAGTLFISLSEERYEGPASELRKLASTKVELFHQHLLELQKEIANNQDMKIVPHVNLNELHNYDEDSSSGPDSDDDDDSNLEENKSKDQGGLHVSLAKPFFLQKQSIQPFINDMKRRISLIHPFLVQFDSTATETEILVNDSGTRSFLTLPICNGQEALENLVASIDSILTKYGLDTYYSDPKFHCSIASWNGNHKWVNDSISILNNKDNRQSSSTNQDQNHETCSEIGKKYITFIIRGIECNFGTTEQHFISFNT